MPEIPYPLTAELTVEIEGQKYSIDATYLKFQIFELMRQLFEEKIGGADIGDVFRASGEVLTLELADDQALYKTGDNELGLKLDGDSLEQSSDGLAIGQSDNISDAATSYSVAGSDTVNVLVLQGYLQDLGEKINEILDLLEERELMST